MTSLDNTHIDPQPEHSAVALSDYDSLNLLKHTFTPIANKGLEGNPQ